jgi:hypothetical protein
MNPKGNPNTLQAQQPGNTNALKFGVYSSRSLAPRAREVADAVLAAPQAAHLDRFAAEEIGRLIALIDAIDADLGTNGVVSKGGKARSLLDYRLRASSRLEKMLVQFGLTPASRINVSAGSFATELARFGMLSEANDVSD